MKRLFSLFTSRHGIFLGINGCLLLTLALFLNCEVVQNTECYLPAKCISSIVDHTSAEADITVVSRNPTDVTINWITFGDLSTASTEMEYRVVYAISPAALDTTDGEDPLPLGVTIAQDWTKNTQQMHITGLTPSTNYEVAVIVRNSKGLMTLLGSREITTPDPLPPVVGDAITFKDTTASSVVVSWGAASDVLTPAAKLQYRLVRSDASTDIDTAAKIKGALASSVTLVEDWTAALTTADVKGLSEAHTYYFAVVVRGQYENYALYTPASMQTLDVTAPTAGTPIVYTNILPTSATVSWGAATDNLTTPGKLRYKLVMASTAAAIDTIAEIDAVTGSNLLMNYTEGVTSKNLTGLTSGTYYYCAVLVEDEAGNKSIYAPARLLTQDTTPPTKGTGLLFTSNLGGNLTVSWGVASDNVTVPANLQYKLVAVPSLSSTLADADAISATGVNGIAMDWTPNVLTTNLTGLTGGSIYNYALLVKDEAGLETLQDLAPIMADDGVDPVPGTGIVFSAVGENGLTLSWGAGSDNKTSVGSLRYKVVTASSSAAINSVLLADAITTAGAGLVMNWSTGALTTTVASGLLPYTTYWYAVIIEDLCGRKALYTPASQRTDDTHPPTVGTGPTFTNVNYTSLTTNWTAAIDNSTATTSLKYKLVQSTDSTLINSVAKVNAITTAGAGLVMDWSVNTLTSPVTSLSDSTTYYFSVLVTDQKGIDTGSTSNMSLYGPSSVTTLESIRINEAMA